MAVKLTLRTLPKLQQKLLAWFRAHRRELPWRTSPPRQAGRDPYRVWVAEVMLQQTRIRAVLPYYRRFLRQFPNLRALARARQEKVLRLWAGLGYYSRARNLHRAANEIMARHGGRFPRDYDAALSLPGVGRYTAAAVLSIAYDAPLAVLDGNVARVLARLEAMRGDLRAPGRWQALEKISERMLAAEAPGDWNQALMELGEVVCTPGSPRCAECPVARWCQARSRGIQDEIPAPRKKHAAVEIKIAAAILRDVRGRTILVKDPGAHDGVLFSRMWQFPAVEVAGDAREELAGHLRSTLGVGGVRLEALADARHAVTFRNIQLLPFLAHVPRLPRAPRTRVLPLERVELVPISSATRKIAQAALCHSP